ncbi:MAG: hypothetical protein L0Z55_07410 [Planctomycetes bacterium]|nr:hypothetical protein [Planctomycetota bacterium]
MLGGQHHAIFALFGSALRADVRSNLTYVVRTIVLLGLLAGLSETQRAAARTGAPGLHLFEVVVMMNVAWITLLGCWYFATALREEREDGMLAPLRITSLNAASILLGTCGRRVVRASILLAVQFPVALLAVALGGISTRQVLDVALVTAGWLGFVTGLGVFTSVIVRRPLNACFFASGVLIAVLWGSWIWQILATAASIAAGGSGNFAANKGGLIDAALSAVASLNPVEIIARRLRPTAGTSSSNLMAAVSLGIGVLLAAIGWWVFASARRDEMPVAKLRGPRFLRRFLRPPIRGKNAIVWKDFYLETGGRGFFFLRIFGYFLLAAFCHGAVGSATRLRAIGFPPLVFELLGFVFLWLEIAYLAARLFRSEFQAQTWSSLEALPFSPSQIVRLKLRAALWALLPVLAFAGYGFFLAPVAEQRINEALATCALRILFTPLWALFFAIHAMTVAHLSLEPRQKSLITAVGIELGALWAVSAVHVCLSAEYPMNLILVPIWGSVLIFAVMLARSQFWKLWRFLNGDSKEPSSWTMRPR